MPTKLVLVPNKAKSRSIKALAGALSTTLGYKVYRVTRDKVRKRTPFIFPNGTDKLTQLNTFNQHGINHPPYTTSRNQALSWLADGGVVMCRTLLRSSEGKGIVISETPEQLVRAPLYTLYLKKKKEFRVHVVQGKVIDVQEKRKKKDFEGTRETKIRNTANGYVFCRDNLQVPEGLCELALRATQVLGYTVGAVDVSYNEKQNVLTVLEVNACPGLMGTTLDKYRNRIVEWYREV